MKIHLRLGEESPRYIQMLQSSADPTWQNCRSGPFLVNLNDYLIDQTGKDWGDLLSGWADLLPPSLTVWLVNRFGDVISVLEDGSVHLLDVSAGTFERIANDREHFADEIDKHENANNWLVIPLVDQCVSAGLVLGPDRCYCYKVPPMLGGQYTFENVATISLPEHYAFLSDIWQQTKDLPEGTPIRLVVKR